VYTPHLPAKIPSLRDLVEGKVDEAVPIPAQFPTETEKSEEVNSHQIRFSDTAQHENLHSNIHPSIMGFTQYPFPETTHEGLRTKFGAGSTFRERELVRKWVEDIFVQNGNDKLLELSTTVERAEKKDGKWVLTLRKDGPGTNYWWQETFDALVVASGHYNVPWIPKVEGLLEYDAKFPGRVLHSKHFRDAKKFTGKVCQKSRVWPWDISTYHMKIASHSRRRVCLLFRNHPRDPAVRTAPCHWLFTR
jgi:hypothetical protein